MKAVDVFVAASGNAFMTDIANWLVEAATLADRSARLVTDRLPDDPGITNLVVAPHEFFLLSAATDAELHASAAVSIPVCTEQPRTPWFQLALGVCRPSSLVLDINDDGVAALQREGVRARRLRLGGVPSMVGGLAERDIDVVFLGGDTDRRRVVLSTLGPVLADRRSELRLFRFDVPVHGDVPGLVFGADKYALLARSRILVNIHRDDRRPAYFEWARMVEAMANGVTVVTEPSSGFAPLEPGVHFVVTDDLASTVEQLLAEPETTATIGRAGASAVLDRYPLVDQLRPVLDHLDGLHLTSPARRRRRPFGRAKVDRSRDLPRMAAFRPATALAERVYRALLAEQHLQRQIDAARCQIHHGSPSHELEFTTPSYGAATPEVSVVVTVYNYAHVVTETLDSLAASTAVDLEIVVVDDHSTDDSRAVVRTFMARRPEVAVLLVGRQTNGGLPRARNQGIERARADKVMILDADNTVYPVCLRRLADTLDADAGASFAYSTLEAFGVDPGLRSHLAWYVPWLCTANYLDAQAMIRREALARHGGYREDDELVYGLEDWDLWLRLAGAGERGAHVPQMLGRYRTQHSSMISTSLLAGPAMVAGLRARYPSLPWCG